MKIVVRGTNWVGDAVMTIPALHALRRIFPEAHIALHIRRWAEGIFRDADFIDEILPFEQDKSLFRTTLGQSKIWRENDFDLAVIFPNSFETALLAKLSKVPKRFGYAKEARSFLLTNPIPIPVWKNERHEIFYYLNLIAKIEKNFFGIESVFEENPVFQLNVSEARMAQARRTLRQNSVDLSRKTVVFVTGSTNSRAKRWQIEGFAGLNDLIQSKLGANVILVGTKDESDVSLQVVQKSKERPINLIGKTTLAELTAVLSVADMLISNDTGPAHIAAALGKKTIVIFGPTNPETTRPWNSEIIRRDVDCSPCMLRDCPIDHRCMTQITPGDVFEKVVSML